MGIENMEKMLAPRSVAVVGASEKPASVGSLVMNNLLGGGYQGQVFPINPNYADISGYRAYTSVSEIPEAADLVIVATPIHTVAGIVADCAARGCGGAVIISAGGKETGEKGASMESQIQASVRESDFRVIGPNCLGIISTGSGLNAGIASKMPKAGKMAFISQSGAICTAILDFAHQEHVGFSYFVSLGSMLDVDFGDMLDYLGSDPQVGSIMMYFENLSRIRNFMSAARAVSRIKPIIALKAGRTPAGAVAAAVHTGVVTGEDAVYDAALKRAGIIRVKTFAELFDCAEYIGKQRRPENRGLAILTNAGGPGVMATDALADYGVEPATLLPETLKKLDEVLPSNWSRSNPLDILGDASAERFVQAARILIDARESDGLLIMLAPRNMTGPTRVAQALVDLLKGQSFPVFTAWLGGTDVAEGRAVFNRSGIPTFDSPERAVRAFMDLCQYTRNIEMLHQIPAKLPGALHFDRETAGRIITAGLARQDGQLTASETGDLLAAYGVKTGSADRAGHCELIVGAKRDRDFGPVLYFGLGGVFTGVFNDRSIALPPLNRMLARRMLEQTRIFRLLDSGEKADSEAVVSLEEMLVRVSQLVTDFAEIFEIFLNPVLIDGGRAFAAVARVVVSPPPVKAPLHLSISAYPNQYEADIDLDDAGRLHIRSIRPEDAPLLEELFASLSPQSVYQRFFGPLKRLPPHMLSRFTQIDYDREVAMVALQREQDSENMIGVSRVIVEPGQKSAEFSIVVADAWHGKGVGAVLLKRCLEIAEERGIEKVWAVVLPGNTKMVALGQKLGFEIKNDPRRGEYVLKRNLESRPGAVGQGGSAAGNPVKEEMNDEKGLYQVHPRHRCQTDPGRGTEGRRGDSGVGE